MKGTKPIATLRNQERGEWLLQDRTKGQRQILRHRRRTCLTPTYKITFSPKSHVRQRASASTCLPSKMWHPIQRTPHPCFISFSSASMSDQLPATGKGWGCQKLCWEVTAPRLIVSGKLKVGTSHRSWGALASSFKSRKQYDTPDLTKSTASRVWGMGVWGSLCLYQCSHWCQQTKLSKDSPWWWQPRTLHLFHAHQLHGLWRKNICSAGSCEADGTAGCLREDLSTLSTLPRWFIPEIPRMEYVLEKPVGALQSGAGIRSLLTVLE